MADQRIPRTVWPTFRARAAIRGHQDSPSGPKLGPVPQRVAAGPQRAAVGQATELRPRHRRILEVGDHVR